MGCNLQEVDLDVGPVLDGLEQRDLRNNVLGVADARLNKEPRDHPGHKPCVRSLVRLKKSLLCNPPPRTKGIQSKKGLLPEVAGDKRKSKNSVGGLWAIL
jgi:hypothetical protein